MRFNRTWKTAYWHGRTLARGKGMWDANFYDTDTHEEFWLSGPHRDRRDTRWSNIEPTVDDDVLDVYNAFLDGAPCPDVSVAERPDMPRSARSCRCDVPFRRRPAWA